MWSCSECTYQNNPNRTICEICQHPKPRQSAVPSPTSPVYSHVTVPAPVPSSTASRSRTGSASSAHPPAASSFGPVSSSRVSSTPLPSSAPSRAPSQANIDLLVGMGFTVNEVRQALQATNNDADQALTLLIDEVKRSPNKVAVTPLNNQPNAKPNEAKSDTASRTTANSNSTSSKPPLASTSAVSQTPKATSTSAASLATQPANNPANSSTTPKSLSTAASQPPNASIPPSSRPSASSSLSSSFSSSLSMDSTADRDRRESERLRLQAELEAERKRELEEKERKVKTDAEAIKLELKAKREAEEFERKKREIEKEKQREMEKAAEVAERAKRREAEEAKFSSLSEALEFIRANYDAERFVALLALLSKILANIAKEPQNEKYRTLKSANDNAIQRVLLRTVGGLAILRFLGFVEDQHSEHESTLTLSQAKLNLNLIRDWLARLQGELNKLHTGIPAAIAKMRSSSSYSPESVYFAVLELKNILFNVVTAPEEKNFTEIDTKSRTYIKRLKPIPEALQILDEFGFHSVPNHIYLVVSDPKSRLQQFETGILEINRELGHLEAETPVFLAFQQARKDIRAKYIRKLVENGAKLIEKIIEKPDETKYQRVNLDKFFERMVEEDIRGVMEEVKWEAAEPLLEAMGFRIDSEARLAVFPMEHFDPELAKLRKEQVERCWKEVVEAARARRE